MTEPIVSSPHRHDGSTVRGVMLRVAVALVPGLLIYTVLFGAGVLLQCLLAVAFALGCEGAMLKLRGLPLAPCLGDGTVIVTGLLFALCISPLAPWWVSFAGVAFAVCLAKHAFGGTGRNLFNPAIAGYVFVLLCFPAQLNQWPPAPGVAEAAPAFGEVVSAVFSTGRDNLDAISGATPLNHMKSRLGSMDMVSEIRADPMYGNFGGRGWEWVALGFLAGGIGLLVLGTIRWHIPVALLASMFAVAGVFHLYDGDVYAPPMFHLLSGGTMLAAFFIATDPVTAATSPRGRLVFGALIGVLTCVIRIWGAFPDGIAFAVLIANGAAPLIDHYTRPRVLGEHRAD